MPSANQLRTAEDWRAARIPRRYFVTLVITPNTTVTAGTTIFACAKTAATNPEIYISRIRVHLWHSAAALAVVMGWKRATSVAVGSGTQITAADINKTETAAANASMALYVPSGAASPTATKGNQYLLTHPAGSVAAPAALTGAGIMDDWSARDLSERIHLTGTEGLTLDWQVASDADIRVHLTMVWEEVS